MFQCGDDEVVFWCDPVFESERDEIDCMSRIGGEDDRLCAFGIHESGDGTARLIEHPRRLFGERIQSPRNIG
jgi:hypothetical protein